MKPVLISGEVEALSVELEELRTLVVLLYTETESEHGEDCPAPAARCIPELCPQERARVLIWQWQEKRKSEARR